MSKMRHLLWLTLAAVLLGACAADPAITPSAQAPDPPSVPDVTMPAATLPAGPEATEPAGDLEARARLAVATWLDVSPNAIRLVSSEAVDWPDAGLGCPQPGLAYAQVVTPGFRFTLEFGGQTYAVHTDLAGRAVPCTAEGVPAFPTIPVTPGEIDDGQPWMPVD